MAAAATATGIGLGFAAARGYPLALPAATIARYGAGSLIRHQAGAIIAGGYSRRLTLPPAGRAD